MSRVKLENTNLLRDAGVRLAFVLEEKLGLSLPQAAKKLGYKNPTTLYKSKVGGTIPHPEKLIKIMELFKETKGEDLDLHWLLTGKGDTYYDSRMQDVESKKYDIINKFDSLTLTQKHALLLLLGD